MQQKGRTEQVLDRLEAMILNAQGALAPGKITVPRDEALMLIRELSSTMQQELKLYRDITDKRAKILREAQKEADDIIYEAEQSASRIRVGGRKTGVAPVRMLDLREEERRALDNANEIYAASLVYTDEMMAEMEDVIADAYEKISHSYERTVRDLKAKSETIAANRRELMEDLRSLEKEDRYQQIMEIGHLLSQELYIARKRNRFDEPQEESGQMNLPLQEMQGKAETPSPVAEKQEEIAPEVEVKPDLQQEELDDQVAIAEAVKEPIPEENSGEDHEDTVGEEQDGEAEPVVIKSTEPTFSESVIGAMQRAAKIAVHGIDEDEEARLEEERASRHRAYLETHEDPVVAMALDERRDSRLRSEDYASDNYSASVRFSKTTELPVKEIRKATDIPTIRFEE